MKKDDFTPNALAALGAGDGAFKSSRPDHWNGAVDDSLAVEDRISTHTPRLILASAAVDDDQQTLLRVESSKDV